MKKRVAAAALALLACESIRARVVESFPSVSVNEVLACATEATMFCASTNVDHDACLVSLARPLTVADASSAVAVPHPVGRMLGIAPEAFRLLVRGETPGREFGLAEASVYVGGDGAHAIFHLAETRIDLSEIT